jgi:hypothetical protein
MERNVMFLSPRPYQSLITIAFLSSEIEVAMSYGKGEIVGDRSEQLCHAH